MSNLDLDVTGRVDGNWQGKQVRIMGGNGSPLEFAYTLVYLLSLSGAVGVSFATFTAVILWYSLRLPGPVVILVTVAVLFAVTAVSHLLLVVSLKLLITTYGGNHQPRDDQGRFIPVYDRGSLTGHLWAKNRRKTAKKRLAWWGGGSE